jgi:hypothetical protein
MLGMLLHNSPSWMDNRTQQKRVKNILHYYYCTIPNKIKHTSKFKLICNNNYMANIILFHNFWTIQNRSITATLRIDKEYLDIST